MVTMSAARSVTAGFTSSAAAPSGSNPVTHNTGGATITIFKTVTVTGRNGRYIPVELGTNQSRRFKITLLTRAKHSHRLANLNVTLKNSNKTVHLKIGRKVKTGTYRLRAQVFTTGKHPHRVGKRIQQNLVVK
jgi:hypothetical protein